MDAHGYEGGGGIAARLRALQDYLPRLQAGTYLFASRLADTLQPAAGPREFVCAAICAAGEFPELYRSPSMHDARVPESVRTLLPRVAAAAGGSDFGMRVRDELARMEREGQGCVCAASPQPYVWQYSERYLEQLAAARENAMHAPRDRRILPPGAATIIDRLVKHY